MRGPLVSRQQPLVSGLSKYCPYVCVIKWPSMRGSNQCLHASACYKL